MDETAIDAWQSPQAEASAQLPETSPKLGVPNSQVQMLLEAPVTEWIAKLSPRPLDPCSLIGQRMGTYHLLELIGRGGSSAVYRAERVVNGVPEYVALKVLLQAAVHSASAYRLFFREQSVLSCLSHPNIVRLLDVGVSDQHELPYLVFELVQGTHILRHALANRLAWRKRLRLMIDLCRTIEAIHHAGLVHCDIKPSNVLVQADGRVKVLDFGIARVVGNPEDTITQNIVLTPAYAAPEQFRRAHATAQIDVYALGVLCSELLLGTCLGANSSILETQLVRRLLTSTRMALLCPVLKKILHRALSLVPEKRYKNAGKLADALEKCLNRESRRISKLTFLKRKGSTNNAACESDDFRRCGRLSSLA